MGDGGWWMVDGGRWWMMVDDGGWRMEDGGDGGDVLFLIT